jgi:hypothetical protein
VFLDSVILSHNYRLHVYILDEGCCTACTRLYGGISLGQTISDLVCKVAKMTSVVVDIYRVAALREFYEFD